MGWMDDLMEDPKVARAVAEARAQYERSVTVACHWGNCSVDVDPLDGKIVGGMGPVMCPCDHVKGWNRSRYFGSPRPAMPAKIRGRHGSRVQRSRQRHTLPRYDDLGGWLPARSKGA